MQINKEKIVQHFLEKDKKLVDHLKRADFDEWFSNKPQNNLEMFESLCRIIVGQQLSGKAATAIYAKFKGLFGTKQLSPKNVLSKQDDKLRAVGLSWAKVKYIKSLAQNFEDKTIDFNKLEKLSDQEVIEQLVKIKGIGKWSAEMFLMFSLHRFNVFSQGDLGLNKAISKIYKIIEPSETKIEKIIKKWEPFKTFGSIALWESLNNK